MKTLDIRRHSRRDAHSAHLNRAGVALARAIGDGSPRYARVLSSPARRAAETAVALGFAVDADCDELALPEERGLALELDLIKNFGDAAMLARGGQHTPAYLARLANWVREVLSAMPDEQAVLMVSHAGVVECLAAALSPDCAELGDGVGFCEGVRMCFHADGRLTMLRLSADAEPRS